MVQQNNVESARRKYAEWLLNALKPTDKMNRRQYQVLGSEEGL